jgi:tight adherence protein C
MNPNLLLPLAFTFVAVALASGSLTSMLLARTAPERRRLTPGRADKPHVSLTARIFAAFRPPAPATQQLAKRSSTQSPKMTRLERRLEAAGWRDPEAASYFTAATMGLPILFAFAALVFAGLQSWLLVIMVAVIGYLLPDLILARATRAHQKSIQNGLPDALDLIVVCVEAGSSLDQAIVRASEELEIALPALAQELRTVTGEIRAGKPRIEAFHDFARRTQLEDVRALVAMLTQTDRFGTSIAQALRTHAGTSRTKRRQRAEERASKVGVKLVFPLALCLVPALYVVCLGPVVVRILRTIL